MKNFTWIFCNIYTKSNENTVHNAELAVLGYYIKPWKHPSFSVKKKKVKNKRKEKKKEKNDCKQIESVTSPVQTVLKQSINSIRSFWPPVYLVACISTQVLLGYYRFKALGSSEHALVSKQWNTWFIQYCPLSCPFQWLLTLYCICVSETTNQWQLHAKQKGNWTQGLENRELPLSQIYRHSK